jgi:hypothetical protein
MADFDDEQAVASRNPCKVLHFQDPPPRHESSDSKETLCYTCYATFSYTSWKYECGICGHCFCSQHGREPWSQISSDYKSVLKSDKHGICIECFVPRRLAMVENAINELLEVLSASKFAPQVPSSINVSNIPLNGLSAEVCTKTSQAVSFLPVSESVIESPDPAIVPSVSSMVGDGITPDPVLLNKIGAHQISQTEAGGTGSAGLLSAAVASPVVLGRVVVGHTVDLVLRSAATGVAAVGSLAGSLAAAPLGNRPTEADTAAEADKTAAGELVCRGCGQQSVAIVSGCIAGDEVAGLGRAELLKRMAELEAEEARLQDRLAGAEALRTRATVTLLQPAEGDVWERGRPGRAAWMSTGTVRRLRLRVGHMVAGYVTSWVELGMEEADWGEAAITLPASLPPAWSVNPILPHPHLQ